MKNIDVMVWDMILALTIMYYVQYRFNKLEKKLKGDVND